MQRVFQTGFDLALILQVFHVDEVDDDQSTEVAQAKLPCYLVSRFHVRAHRSFFDVRALGGARGVHIDRDQRFGVIDHDRATRRQRHLARVRSFDLVFDLKAREQRHVVLVALYTLQVVGHHVRHELARLLVDIVGVDQDLANLGMKIVANRADHQVRLFDDQERWRIGSL